MFVLTGSAPFTSMKPDLEPMVPPIFPRPGGIIDATGALEFLAAAGLLVPKVRSVAGGCLRVLLVAMFRANVWAAREREPLHGKPATALGLRFAMQIFFIGLIAWASR
jgi:uncharacterized membrane protein